jgi:hypothetical protein
MTLWIQPLIGDPLEIPFSPPDATLPGTWSPIYRYLHQVLPFSKEIALHQLRLLHNGSFDLSGVKEGDVLHLLVTDPMVEQWISEVVLSHPSSSSDPLYRFHLSTMSWLDGRWGDPYEKPEIQYRTPLTLRVMRREFVAEGRSDYTVNPDYFRERYPPPSRSSSSESEWYPTLREALHAHQQKREKGEEMTDKTIEHLHHLWGLYHGTNEHLVRQGKYYE